MKLFNRKPSFCAICNKQLKHKHKPKKEWDIQGDLCGDCHLRKMQEFYEGSMRQNCVHCGINKKISDLWEPRWQWDMEGLLCKTCFDKKEEDFKYKKEYCSQCGTKLGFIRYNPKPKWMMDGQLCKNCWDSHKAKMG
ncbi:MAG: hypothetical protein GWN01_06660 [Nitrosopumilaceae archaeon]|nr:hypothetical protein [Nitrosopumilaceae archaeon]NIU00616.1 hypothetical protein [Nitrosopumilaceae archaeon]NIU87002.1 hypothetical protein [Nitrosopumilaceae archaeon]NIV66466.1 hypothetical protein [Nitrosopumilaceae archaeon]NIX61218.1 hypothetical protein [Nitrosopumilaceae archaeon]